jgi:hypothetical protein
MKKSLILIYLSVFFCVAISAQENPTTTTTTTTTTQVKNEKLVSKKGIYILPEQGEFALGVDATPFLNYLGNALNLYGNNAPQFNYGNGFSGGNAVYGKYMLADNKAVRVRLGFSDNKKTILYPVQQDQLTPDANAPQFVNDEAATLNRSFYVAIGLENHRGKSRIQGVYGAELFFGSARTDINYVYGNPMNNNFNHPTMDGTLNGNGLNYVGDQRLIEDNSSKSIFGGVRGFVGVEYFIAPKLSIGGEFGYSFIAQKNGTADRTYELWDGSTLSVQKITTRYNNNNSFKLIGLDTDNLSGSINIFLYF